MNIRVLLFLLVIFAASGYFFFQAQGVLFAPALEVFEPKNGDIFSTTRIVVSGTTGPDLNVVMKGVSTRSDSGGFFENTLNLFPGYNEIGIFVEDKFGSRTEKIVKVFIE
jgi:hypothetical protein